MRKSEAISLGIILLALFFSIYFYPSLPEKMAVHWNLKGEVDRYLSKQFALLLIPAISLAMLLLFILIPKIDPLRQNIEEFRKYYDGFLILITAFLIYVHFLVLGWNLKLRFSMLQALSPAFAILLYYLGTLTENAKQNWFVGIRTPWTLSSEKVWQKTHKIGGKLFRICGVIALIGFFFPDLAFLFIFVPLLSVCICMIAYSYFEYRKVER